MISLATAKKNKFVLNVNNNLSKIIGACVSRVADIQPIAPHSSLLHVRLKLGEVT
jgi:hypothetical protein|tara:strand:- start:386 stop:550 length:165 start_codon:yes stop_codon:yes gene_type:complete